VHRETGKIARLPRHRMSTAVLILVVACCRCGVHACLNVCVCSCVQVVHPDPEQALYGFRCVVWDNIHMRGGCLFLRLLACMCWLQFTELCTCICVCMLTRIVQACAVLPRECNVLNRYCGTAYFHLCMKILHLPHH